jgi:serine/threonine protein kinase
VEFRKLLGRFLGVCDAIAYAHSKGVLHRDLKPANIMLGPYGETLVVDWGLAKVVGGSETPAARKNVPAPGVEDSAATHAGTILGTPAYMSPEQACGDVSGLSSASDVYSLGATLYWLLTGKPPFGGTDVPRTLEQVRLGQFPPPRAALHKKCRWAGCRAGGSRQVLQ